MLQQLIKDSEAENSRICGKSGRVGCACVVHELCAPVRTPVTKVEQLVEHKQRVAMGPWVYGAMGFCFNWSLGWGSSVRVQSRFKPLVREARIASSCNQHFLLVWKNIFICIDCSLLPIWEKHVHTLLSLLRAPVYVGAFVSGVRFYFRVVVALRWCLCLFRVLGVDFVLFRRSRCSYFSLRSWAVKLHVMAAEAREAQESFEVLAPTLKVSQWIFAA